MMPRFAHKIVAVSLMVTSSLIPNLLYAPAASAQAALRSPLHLVAGEDPSTPGAAAPAAGDARFVLPDRLRVGLSGLDPARFPADASCNAEVRIGQLSAKGLIPVLLPVANPENVFGVPVTMVDFRGVGIGHPGDTAQVRIRCQFVDAAGVRQRHETLWATTL
jgi:hypothetical protein